jgi:site-specific recombinase XerD
MAEKLEALGYCRLTAAKHMGLVGRLSRSMGQQGRRADELSAEVLEEFFADLRARNGASRPTAKCFRWLLEYLREVGVATETSPAPGSAKDRLVGQYRRYLVDERGVAPKTVVERERAVRLFLSQLGSRELGELSAADVSQFVTRQCRQLSVPASGRLVSGLRSFLRFALVEGLVSSPVGAAVPSVPCRVGVGLPRGLSSAQVRALLASCDRRRAPGRRDYAILVLLVRLGLRAAEVAALRLDDIDWRAGEVVVRGKGRTEERLPLPPDVGGAVAEYLQQDRPQRTEREVFLRARAPFRGLAPGGVSEVVRGASERAGLGSFGAHRLRHTCGTELLRAGASLPEVAQVLRHRRLTTTAIYANPKILHLTRGVLVRTSSE